MTREALVHIVDEQKSASRSVGGGHGGALVARTARGSRWWSAHTHAVGDKIGLDAPVVGRAPAAETRDVAAAQVVALSIPLHVLRRPDRDDVFFDSCSLLLSVPKPDPLLPAE